MNVTIDDYTQETKILAGTPMLFCRWRAGLPCGCCVWVGVRGDNGETATCAYPCGRDHLPLIEDFNALMRASLLVPTDRPLIDVVAQLLDAAYLPVA